MKNFELFVDEIVNKWRVEKKVILESGGLGKPSNRQVGDLAEEYILKKVKNLSPKYLAFRSKASQTPSDIYSVARRNGYWHIMLIQVKSSTKSDAIYKLNDNDKKVFDELAKFIKNQIGKSKHLMSYKTSAIIISTGYAGVYRNESGKTIRHSLAESKAFKIFKRNTTKLDINSVKEKISLTHQL